MEEMRRETNAMNFSQENRSNIWDVPKSQETEDDLDVPPSLRARFRKK